MKKPYRVSNMPCMNKLKTWVDRVLDAKTYDDVL